MVRVDKRTNIFNLIANKDSTVEDFKKLFDIAPEKFKLKEPIEGMNPEEVARKLGRTDLIEYLQSKMALIDDYTIINAMSLPTNDIKEIIKNVDLSKLSNTTQDKIIAVIMITPIIKELLHKLYLIFNNPKGGININIKQDAIFGKTPVFFAFARSDNIELFKKLVEKFHPDLNVKSSSGNTITSTAISNRNYELTKFLLNNGVNINDKIENNIDYISYIYRTLRNNTDIMIFLKLFIDKGLNIDSPLNNLDYTLLMVSIANAKKELFDYALENGANPWLEDKSKGMKVKLSGMDELPKSNLLAIEKPIGRPKSPEMVALLTEYMKKSNSRKKIPAVDVLS
jgi:hypothetical protein